MLAVLIAVPLAMRADTASASGHAVLQTPGPEICLSTWDCSVPPLLNLDQALYHATPEQKASLRKLEDEAIASVITSHGLSAGDTAAVQSWGRERALAELWLVLLNAINADPRSTDQQHAVDWLSGIAAGQPHSKAALTAQAAGLEYVKWAGLDELTYQSLVNKSSTTQSELTAFLDDHPQPWIPPHYATGYCAYRSPEPHASEYTHDNNPNCYGTCPNILGCNPPTPSYDQFVKWGEAAASYELLTSADYSRTSHKTGLAAAVGVSAAVAGAIPATATVASHAARIAQNGQVAARAAKAAVRFNIPTAVGVSTGAAVVGVATIVIVAVVIAVVQGIAVINASQLPGQLAELVIESRTTPGDLKSLAGTSDGMTSLFSIFVGATLPTPVHETCDNSAALPPGITTRGAVYVITGAPPCLNPSPIPGASPVDPQFLTQREGDTTWTRSATITYRDHAAGTTTTARLHKNWFITETNGAVAQTLRFTYTDWDGEHQHGSLLGPDDEGDYTFFSLHDSNAEFDVQTCVADGVCTKSDTLRYLAPDGKKTSAKVEPYAAPTGTPTYTPGDEGEELTFDANGFKPGSAEGAISYRWGFQRAGCGMPCQTTQTLPASPDYEFVNGAKVDHAWGHSGEFSVQLTATDSAGRTASTTFPVTVGNVPPVMNVMPDCTPGAEPGVTCHPRTAPTNTAVNLGGTFDDAGVQSALTVAVNWGDGTAESDCISASPPICFNVGENGVELTRSVDGASYVLNASHAYTAPGTYYGTVWVSDRSGGEDSEAFAITIPGAVPAAPGDLHADVAPAAGVGSGQVKLAWTAPAFSEPAVTDYRIERSADRMSWTPVPDPVSTATTSTLDEQSIFPTWYRVTAVNALGMGPPSDVTQASARYGPHAPMGLTAVVSPEGGVGSGQVRLSWGNPLIGTEVTSYLVGWSADGETWTTVSVGAQPTSYTVDGLANLTPHRFRVVARGPVGVSPPSEIQATPVGTPSAPAGLTAAVAPAAGAGSGQVRLTWQAAPAAAGVTDYVIESSLDGETWTAVDDGVSTATTHTVGGLTNGTAYSFRVAAVNAVGAGQWSAPVESTPVWLPAAPADVTAVAPLVTLLRQARLSWSAPPANGSAITDYVIQSTLDGTTWTTVNDGVSPATTHTVNGLINALFYRFRIAAKNAVGIGPWSAPVRPTPVVN